MPSRIKWGILGTSYISEVMAEAIQQSDTGELVAIGSRSFSSATKFAEKFSIPKQYGDYQSLLNDDDINVIYIGLPNHLHKEWIIRAAQAGKNILCEKPFVISTAEAREVISVVEKCDVFCMEALMYRCHPFIKKLHELIQNKTIGDIKLYTATYTANIADLANTTAGGSIRNLGCYPVSLVRLLENAEPIEIRALGRMNHKNKNDSQASAILKFESDTIAVVSTADDIKMFHQFDVLGSDGSIKIVTNPWLPDCIHNKMIIYKKNGDTPIEINVTAEKSLYTYQIDTVGDRIINKHLASHNAISLGDSLANIDVLEAWLQFIA